MDVAVSEFRAHLSEWLARAQQGDEVVVTDRGTPVARVVGVEQATTLEQLTERGVIARPSKTLRPTATGRERPRSRRPVASRVSEHRG